MRVKYVDLERSPCNKYLKIWIFRVLGIQKGNTIKTGKLFTVHRVVQLCMLCYLLNSLLVLGIWEHPLDRPTESHEETFNSCFNGHIQKVKHENSNCKLYSSRIMEIEQEDMVYDGSPQ